METSTLATKICRACGVELPIDRFRLTPDKRYRRGTCTQCFNSRNRDKDKLRHRRWLYTNRARVARVNRAYQETHRWVKRVVNANMRAKQAGASCVPFTVAQLIEHWVFVGIDPDECFYCGDASGSIDHYVPLNRGGPHRLCNVVPACLDCNLTKGTKLPEEL